MGIVKKAIPIATILAVLMSLLTLLAPVYAWQTHTWDTKANFDAGVLIKVDTAYSPNDVMLAASLDKGYGADGPLSTGGLYFIDSISTAVSSTSYIGSSYIYVGSTTGFAAGQEVLIIQMTGTGAGTWETLYVGGTGLNTLIFTGMAKHAYYADVNSKAQAALL